MLSITNYFLLSIDIQQQVKTLFFKFLIQENKKALTMNHQCFCFGKVLSYSAATASTEVSTKD
jgi:hypothetical protein